MGVWINEQNQTITTAYGDNTGPLLSLRIEYSTRDENGKALSEFVQAEKDDVVTDENGITTITIRGTKGEVQAELSFLRSDAVADTVSHAGDRYSYITGTIHVKISDGNGGMAKNIQSLTLNVPTLPYDDYMQTGIVPYTGTATLSGAESLPELTAEGSVSVNYNQLGTPSISSSTYDPSMQYDYIADRVYTNINSCSNNYRGNYYWVEFDPEVYMHDER